MIPSLHKKKITLAIGIAAALTLVGFTVLRATSDKEKDEAPTTPETQNRAAAPNIYERQEMSPASRAQLDRLKSMADGLKMNIERTRQTEESSPYAEDPSARMMQTLSRTAPAGPSNSTESVPRKSDPSEYHVRDQSSRDKLLEGLDRLGTPERRAHLRQLLKSHRPSKDETGNPPETDETPGAD